MKKILYIFYFFLIFELILFGIAELYSVDRTSDNIIDNRKNIICIGDSYTFGVLVEKNETYPFYLENLLNNNENTGYSVINKGKPGSNSRYVVDNLENFIELYKPETVIVLTGMNNNVNFSGLTGSSFFSKIYLFFNNLRIVRFIKNLSDILIKDKTEQKIFNNIAEKNFNISDFVDKDIINMTDYYKKNKNLLKKLDDFSSIHENLNEEFEKINQAEIYAEKGDVENVLKIYNSLFEKHSDNWEYYFAAASTLDMFFREQYSDKIKNYIISGLKVFDGSLFDPENKDFSLSRIDSMLFFLTVLKEAYFYDVAYDYISKIYDKLENNNKIYFFKEYYVLNFLNKPASSKIKEERFESFVNILFLLQNNFIEMDRHIDKQILHFINSEKFEYMEIDKVRLILSALPYNYRSQFLNNFFKGFDSEYNFNLIFSEQVEHYIKFIVFSYKVIEKSIKEKDFKQAEFFIKAVKDVMSNYKIKHNFTLNKNEINLYYQIIKNNSANISPLIKDFFVDELENVFNMNLFESNQYIDTVRDIFKNTDRKNQEKLYPLLISYCYVQKDYSQMLDYQLEFYEIISDKTKKEDLKQDILTSAALSNRTEVVEKYFSENKKIFDLYFNSPDKTENIKLWLKKDIEEIIKICKNNDINLILMNYFEHDEQIIKETAFEHNIMFVDNYKKAQFLKQHDMEKYKKMFLPDRHLSPEGNKMKAENIYEEMSRLFFLRK